MDNALQTIVLLVIAVFVLIGVVAIALFVTSDDFKDFMAEEPVEQVQEPTTSTNATTNVSQVVDTISFKQSTIDKIFWAMGVNTTKKDSIYESKALMYSTIRMVTILLITLGAIIGIISLFSYLKQKKSDQ